MSLLLIQHLSLGEVTSNLELQAKGKIPLSPLFLDWVVWLWGSLCDLGWAEGGEDMSHRLP